VTEEEGGTMAGRNRPEFTIMLSGLHRIFGPDPRYIIEAAQVLEQHGVAELLLGDHVVMGENTHTYPYGPFAWPFEPPVIPRGDPKIGPDEPWFETLTLLAGIATATSTIRLGTGVLLAPLRPPVLLAKTVATLDALSGGRVELGVGVGWQREEYESLGLDYAQRWRLLDDAMLACRRLWEDLPASFSSASVSFTDIYCVPQPVQPRIPVSIGAQGRPGTARRIASYGDGWFPLTLSEPDEIAPGASRIRAAMVDAGRDPDALQIRVPLLLKRNRDGRIDGPATMAPVPALAELGVTGLWVVIGPQLGVTSMREIGDFTEQLLNFPRD
jgi:probable F420-dependent oxidoreductase